MAPRGSAFLGLPHIGCDRAAFGHCSNPRVCDLIIADKMARFCFPELRLGLIPGFGGIPRLKRDGDGEDGIECLDKRQQHPAWSVAIGLSMGPAAGGSAPTNESRQQQS